MTLLGPRRHDQELLDEPGMDTTELDQSLDHVAAVNRWLGGERALRLHLAALRHARQDVRVLDVGTGNAALLRRIVRWGRGGGGRWSGVGLDLYSQMLGSAVRGGAREEVALVRADALRLPFPPGSFDVALCTLTLHHFSDEDAARLIRELAAVATRLVVVNDLARGFPGYLSARVLSSTWWRRNRITRHDGPLSVLRSFTADELRVLGRRGGLRDVKVRRRFPFRLVLEGRP